MCVQSRWLFVKPMFVLMCACAFMHICPSSAHVGALANIHWPSERSLVSVGWQVGLPCRLDVMPMPFIPRGKSTCLATPMPRINSHTQNEHCFSCILSVYLDWQVRESPNDPGPSVFFIPAALEPIKSRIYNPRLAMQHDCKISTILQLGWWTHSLFTVSPKLTVSI